MFALSSVKGYYILCEQSKFFDLLSKTVTECPLLSTDAASNNFDNLNRFLERAGVSEQQLSDRRTREFIKDFILSNSVSDPLNDEQSEPLEPLAKRRDSQSLLEEHVTNQPPRMPQPAIKRQPPQLPQLLQPSTKPQPPQPPHRRQN